MSEQNQSSLPPMEEIERLHLMSLSILRVNDFPSENMTLGIEIDSGEDKQLFTGPVFKLDFEQHEGYLPSKAWIDSDDCVLLSYYKSSVLPPQARPFDGPLYVCYVKQRPGMTIRYDANARMFIDQLITNQQCTTLFIFDQKQLDQLLPPTSVTHSPLTVTPEDK